MSTSIKELAKQSMSIDSQIWEAAKNAFEKMSDAGLIREERHIDGEYVMVPTDSFEFSGYELEKNGIEMKGQYYAGCGEYEHMHITVPYEAFDNIAEYIAQQAAIYAEAERKKAEEEAAKEAQRKLEQEQAEREHFQTLKEKYEGAAQ